MTSRELLRAAAQGDRKAWAEVYERYHDRIRRYMTCHVSHDDADDLTSKVFLKALEHYSSLKDLGWPINAWLFRIARNTVIDYYRTRHMTFSLENLIDPEERGSWEEEKEIRDATVPWVRHIERDPMQQVEDQADNAEVLELLRMLTPQQRRVLDLYLFADYSLTEISHMLGLDRGRVNATYHRALVSMRAANQRRRNGR